MTDLPNIINTNIISEDANEWWQDISSLTTGLKEKNTLVLSTVIDSESPLEAQLNKVLQACQLTPDSYNLLMLADDKKVAWHQLRDQLKPKNIILFGITTDQLGVSIHFMPHQVNRFNECSWIPTLSIAQLEQYPDIKKHLWNYGLKPVFIEKIYG